MIVVKYVVNTPDGPILFQRYVGFDVPEPSATVESPKLSSHATSPLRKSLLTELLARADLDSSSCGDGYKYHSCHSDDDDSGSDEDYVYSDDDELEIGSESSCLGSARSQPIPIPGSMAKSYRHYY